MEQITKDISTATGAIADWRDRAAGVLTALRSTVDKQGMLGRTYAPRLVVHANSVLDPGRTVELEIREIAAFLADAEATEALLDLLPTVRRLDAALAAHQRDLLSYTPWQQAWYAESRGLIDEILEDLRTADSGKDLVAADLRPPARAGPSDRRPIAQTQHGRPRLVPDRDRADR